MRYDNLPIYKACLDLCIYIETIVKSFEKYHKYSIGQDLRTHSKDMLFLIHKANIQRDKQEFLKELLYKGEELKMLIQISKKEFLCHYKHIKSYLIKNLKLSLRDKYILKQNNQGLDFLGYILRPYYVLSQKRVVNNYRYKKAKFLEYYEKNQGKVDKDKIDKFLSIKASFLGHIKHGNCKKLKKQLGEINEKKYITKFSACWST